VHGDNAAIDREPKGSAAMGTALDRIGHLLARYLEKPVQGYEPFTPSDPAALCARLRPGDVLLVENNNRVGRHQYLTQSTWSHAALLSAVSATAKQPMANP
jgi:3-phosphoglycerate kinase